MLKEKAHAGRGEKRVTTILPIAVYKDEKNELQTVEAISLLVSCGSNLSQNAPNIMPRSPQKMHIVNR
jgi:hypothetical protein